MTRQLRNFTEEFLDYDAVIITKGVKFMRIKVKIDVRNPLRRRKRIVYERDKTSFVYFKYEKVSLFCFLCGRLGHGESFYSLWLAREVQEDDYGWDISLRASPRRMAPTSSRWLRDNLRELVKVKWWHATILWIEIMLQKE